MEQEIRGIAQGDLKFGVEFSVHLNYNHHLHTVLLYSKIASCECADGLSLLVL